ncbi:MAG: hypothetical protein H6709_19020 [Kofleriaceae bacterium]|nr:hypothetical protein [Kofleriaceae bacterium]MCB9574182.1 hypothetical protein [Kofleriaceae bacterium]
MPERGGGRGRAGGRAAAGAIAALIVLVATAAVARAGKPARIYAEVAEVAADEALGRRGPPLVAVAEAALPGVLARHPRVVVAGDADAPALEGGAAAVKRALRRHELAGAYALHAMILACQQRVTDGDRDGDGDGHHLAVTIQLDLAGEALPGGALAWSAGATATIEIDVAGAVRAADRHRAVRAAIEAAATEALDRGVEQVAPSKRRPGKRKR